VSGHRLGEILKDSGVISEQQLEQALQFQKGKRLRIGEVLVQLGFASETDVTKALARQSGIPFIDLSKGNIAPQILKKVRKDLVEKHRFLPVMERTGKLVVAIDDPSVAIQLDDLSFVLGAELQAALATPSQLVQRIRECYEVDLSKHLPAKDGAPAASEAESEDAPIIRLVQHMLEEAYQSRASDIHVEPRPGRVRVRFRIDGVLRDVAAHPGHLHGPLLSRLKLMAGMDIAEKRKPQDGRIQATVGTNALDIRASILPASHGESMVMRLLDKQRGLVSLSELGFGQEDYARFQALIKRPNGIILVTGPTGSGKTTTLYAALKELNRSDRKIITAEDPVEYQIPGINQVQVKHRIGLDFARILRAMLRQAPNVILVGEVRDRETADVAIQAALTGHLVFSTLHTNDAPSALTRLIEMGVAPFLVAASVHAIMAQRLVRQLCSHCKQPVTAQAEELETIGLLPDEVRGRTLYHEQKCHKCDQTGFRGRKGLFELLEMDQHLRDMTFHREPHLRVREEAIQSGRMSTLLKDGQRKVIEGTTSIREVLRVVSRTE